jgi:hypothetical protein
MTVAINFGPMTDVSCSTYGVYIWEKGHLSKQFDEEKGERTTEVKGERIGMVK